MKAKHLVSTSIILLLTFFHATEAQVAVEQTLYSGACMQCLLANSTFVYCPAYSKCYDRPVSGCGTVQTDIMQSFACSKDII